MTTSATIKLHITAICSGAGCDAEASSTVSVSFFDQLRSAPIELSDVAVPAGWSSYGSSYGGIVLGLYCPDCQHRNTP